jgi:ribosomal protein S27AE
MKAQGGGVTTKKCPKCGSTIRITSTKRPLKVSCDSCGKGFMLRDKAGAAQQNKSGSDKTDIALCPHCGSPTPVAPEEKSTTCGSCGKGFQI